MLMIDGIVDNSLFSQIAEIGPQYALSNIQRIEFVYGPASALYGPNAFLGIVNIITKDASNFESDSPYSGKVITHFGADNTYIYDGTISYYDRDSPINFTLTFRKYTSDEHDFTNYKIPDGPVFGERMSDTTTHGIFATDKYTNLQDNFYIHSKAGIGNITLGTLYWKREAQYGLWYSPRRNINDGGWWNLDSKQYYVKSTNDLLFNVTSNVTLSYRESNILPSSTFIWGGYLGYYSAHNSSFLYDHQFNITIDDDFSIIAGLKYESKDLQKDYDEIYGGDSKNPDADIYPQQPTLDPQPHNRFKTVDIGAFVQVQKKINKVNITGGLRWDDNSIYGKLITPRLVGNVNITESLIWKIMYGEGFQEGSPKDLYASWGERVANEDLSPEKVKVVETSINHTHNISNRTRINSELNFFHSKITDKIAQIGGTTVNYGDLTLKGLEGKVRLNSFNPTDYLSNLKLDFNFSYIFSADDVDASQGDISDIKTNIILHLQMINNIGFNIRGNYIGKRKTITSNPLEEFDSYFLVNTSLSYRFETIRMALNIDNLLDADFSHPGARSAGGYNTSYLSEMPQPGRKIFLNLSYDF